MVNSDPACSYAMESNGAQRSSFYLVGPSFPKGNMEATTVYLLCLNCACAEQFWQFDFAPQLRILHLIAGQLESQSPLQLDFDLAHTVFACHFTHAP